MGISPLGERPKRRGRSVEGARTYALDLDEEEEEEEEHQEDDWVRLHNGPQPTLIEDT